MPSLYKTKDMPPPSLSLVAHPERDSEYVHFSVSLADGSTQPAATALPFDAAARRRFSPVNAWWLSEAALLSYWNGDTATERFGSQAGLKAELIDVAGTQCYVAANDSFTLVAFRGTQPNEAADVWSDVRLAPVDWPKGGSVHGGFKQALDVVWEPLSARLRGVPGDTVWFTGHSLGGALATLAADLLGEAAGVYTFGSPRVGKANFVSGFDSRHGDRSFRFVNNHDAVTHLPPSAWEFGHVDKELHINSAGEIGKTRAGDGMSVIREAAERLAAGVDKVTSGASILPGGLVDHTPRRYCTVLWNAVVAGEIV